MILGYSSLQNYNKQLLRAKCAHAHKIVVIVDVCMTRVFLQTYVGNSSHKRPYPATCLTRWFALPDERTWVTMGVRDLEARSESSHHPSFPFPLWASYFFVNLSARPPPPPRIRLCPLAPSEEPSSANHVPVFPLRDAACMCRICRWQGQIQVELQGCTRHWV